MGSSIGALLLAGVGALFLIFLVRGIYYAFFHPLSKVPGPKLWVFSDIIFLYYMYCGVWPFKIKELHEKYGPVVRFTVNDVSFIGPGAWKVLHGNQRGDPKNMYQKDMRVYRPTVSGHMHIINANDEDHRRHRRILGYAFSDKALRGQEPVVQQYIDLMIKKLTQRAVEYGMADLTQWLNFVTFDLIGDLSFGESLGNLERGEYHPWVSVLFESVKLMAFSQAIQRHPTLGAFVMWFVPAKFKHARLEHWRLANRMARKRLASGDAWRDDFMSHILAHNEDGEKGHLTDEEIVENAYILVVAGSETSATQLCGTMYYLLMDRDKLDLVMAEICAAFGSEKEINGEGLAKLEYFNACIEESLRIYPAIPTTLPRYVPEGGQVIEGYWIPGGTGVGIPPLASGNSETNFHNATKFAPERWLGDPTYAGDKLEASQPFSIGPRNCIGKNLAYLEMRLILARLLWNFDFEITPQSRGWLEGHKVYMLNQRPPLFVKIKPSLRAATNL